MHFMGAEIYMLHLYIKGDWELVVDAFPTVLIVES